MKIWKYNIGNGLTVFACMEETGLSVLRKKFKSFLFIESFFFMLNDEEHILLEMNYKTTIEPVIPVMTNIDKNQSSEEFWNEWFSKNTRLFEVLKENEQNANNTI